MRLVSRAEEALLVGVQHGHQADLRQVQALAQEVDAHQHVELGQAQVPDNLHPLHGADVRVHIPDPDAALLEVVVRSSAIFLVRVVTSVRSFRLGAGVDFAHQVVDLALHRPDHHLRVQQARGPDDLLDDLAGALGS